MLILGELTISSGRVPYGDISIVKAVSFYGGVTVGGDMVLSSLCGDVLILGYVFLQLFNIVLKMYTVLFCRFHWLS